MRFKIRAARPEDAETLAQLIVELADYERLAHEAFPDADELRRHLAPDAQPRCEALIAENTDTGAAAGMALYFYNYSTFITRWGIFLEDLYVREAFRGQGAGFALLKHLATIATSRGCKRLEWNVLDWNDTAITFYRKLGAEAMDDWTTMRLTGTALTELGRIEAQT